MVEETDIQELVLASIKGDSEAFGKLYDELAPKVFNFILARVKHKDTAEDLLHTVFMKAWNNLPRYKPRKNAKFSTWLFQIANFTVIDYWRTRKETVELEKVENFSVFAKDQKMYETYEFLWKAMKDIPDDYQNVIQLRYMQDLSVRETAEVMGKSEVGVRVLQHRAMKALKKALKDTGHEIF